MKPDFFRVRTGDHFSEVLDLVEVGGVVTGGIAVYGAWTTPRFPIDVPLKFAAVVRGQARLSTDGLDQPLTLDQGDIAILNCRSWAQLEGGDGGRPALVEAVDDDLIGLIGSANDVDHILFGGHIDLNPAGYALLASTLPPVAHVHASSVAGFGLRRVLDRMVEELIADRAGASFAIRQHGQLLVLELLRAHLGQADLPPGWLRVSTDRQLSPALALMHAEPSRRPSVDELARAASMSRTSFAERFREVAGVPPVAYLSRWRMLHAQRALRDSDIGIKALAAELGYASESAFSTAFKRSVGEAPLRYRQRLRR
ncbi:cupin domain-containing protein [Catenuloplanes sp. NPDC051500]|uniref:AraC family transcriptional regulator n=1 Tax=Catenuloplanes sp. NPDC051500 TaxID=3363959 RepID=UPI0037983C12